MKKVAIVLSRIHKYLSSNRLFTAVYLLGVFSAVMMVLLSYGRLIAANRQYRQARISSYGVSLQNQNENISPACWEKALAFCGGSDLISMQVFSTLNVGQFGDTNYMKAKNEDFLLTATYGKFPELTGSGHSGLAQPFPAPLLM